MPLTLVRQALGDDAVVLSTKPCAEGVEVLAMAPGRHAGRSSAWRLRRPRLPRHCATTNRGATGPHVEARSTPAAGVDEDVAQLTMSTLSFQDYVRERMLRRRQAALDGKADVLDAPAAAAGARQARARAGCRRRVPSRCRVSRPCCAKRLPLPRRPRRSAPASRAGPTARCWPTPARPRSAASSTTC